ncbi:MAG: radical SAM protein [Elusimicrobia bacterium]|nr:radical SAM protein [Elusimicrobiota bacterium]
MVFALDWRELSAPLYVGWQLTNECNLACRHCLERSGPGRRGKDELDRKARFKILEEFVKNGVTYVAFSGGEPLRVSYLCSMCEFLCRENISVKIETNGQGLSLGRAKDLAGAGVKAVQVSLDGASAVIYEQLRAGGKFKKALDAIKHLTAAGLPVEVNFSPVAFNIHEIEKTIDLAASLGVFSFYTGPLMRCGRAALNCKSLGPTAGQYDKFFQTLEAKAVEYKGKMRIYFNRWGIVEELKVRLKDPAAVLIVLPNGKAKIINSLPFICGDLSRQSLTQVWENFKKAWADPRVAHYIAELSSDETLLDRLHEFIELYPLVKTL